MRYKTLGTTGEKLSALTLGTWGIGGTGWGETSQSNSLAAIDRMLELGVNLVDTAPVYGFGNPGEQDFGFGCAERLLAKALKGRRDKVFLVTKCGLNYDRSKGPSSAYRSMSAQEIREGCENSLRRLGTDYLDLLLVHWPDGKTPLEEVAQAMEDLIRRGLIKYYGVSNFSVEDTLRLHKMLPMQAVQLQFSLVSRQTEQTLQTLHDAGIGTMAYGALGSGILTGAYRTKPEFGPGDMRSSFYHFFEEPTFSKVQGLLKIMDEIAGKYDVPLSQVALNWVAGCPFVDTAIVGANKVSHAEQCAGAFAWQLSEEDHRLLSQASMETLG